jgi:hypothetical protein
MFRVSLRLLSSFREAYKSTLANNGGFISRVIGEGNGRAVAFVVEVKHVFHDAREKFEAFLILTNGYRTITIELI